MTSRGFLRLAPIPCLAVLICCSGKPSLDQLQPGMTEPEVIKRLGKPESVAVQGRLKVYRYHSYWGLEHHDDQWWFVRFIDGRVESFGHMGDFDSTKPPAPAIVIDHDSTKAGFDLGTELARLDRLKASGEITDDEYEALRKHAIEKAKSN